MSPFRIAPALSSVIAMVFVIALAYPVAASPLKAPAATPLIHCSMRLAANPLVAPTLIDGAVIQEARVVDSRCFRTFAEALEYGSDGNLKVPANLRPDQLTASMVNASSASTPYLLGINYHCKNWADNIACPTFSHFASSGCTPTSGWQIAALVWGEANYIQSSKGFSGCNRTRHWEHPNFQGVTYLCLPNCSDLYVLDNQTDSIRWWG